MNRKNISGFGKVILAIITLLLLLGSVFSKAFAWGPYVHAEIAKEISYAIKLDLAGHTEKYNVPDAVKYFVLGAVAADMGHANGPFDPRNGRASDNIKFTRELVNEASKYPWDYNLQAFAWGWYAHVYMDEVNNWDVIYESFKNEGTMGQAGSKPSGPSGFWRCYAKMWGVDGPGGYYI